MVGIEDKVGAWLDEGSELGIGEGRVEGFADVVGLKEGRAVAAGRTDSDSDMAEDNMAV